jgi:catecholate siderophore receptor
MKQHVRPDRGTQACQNKRQLLATTAITLLCMSGVVQAAETGGNPQAPLVLPTLQVEGKAPPTTGYAATRSQTATKTDTPLIDVPQSVTVVTKEAIKDLSMQSMADVVRYVPGVQMAQGEGNRDTPVLRGNSSTADFFVDGIRDDVEYFRDLYNADRIEALKGSNAMIFGRGGAGGVINRVTRVADWNMAREITLQTGSYRNRRATVDVNQSLNDAIAGRVTAMYEDSNTFRQGGELKRYAINPTIALALSDDTRLTLGYEHFHDERTADRGIPSYLGVPLNTGRSQFFGNAEASPTHTTINAFNMVLEHSFNENVEIRNRFRYADYDKFYQNVFPGAVNPAGTTVSISGYNNGTRRENVFNQTDLIFSFDTVSVKHKFLAGLELGRQVTDNFRQTAYFNTPGGPTSLTVPVSNPVISNPVFWAQNATDADNHTIAEVVSVYVQDQIEIIPEFELVLGARYDKFKVNFLNNRTAVRINGSDGLFSPRLGAIYKPLEQLSFYASYSKTYLPRSGAQLTSLTVANSTLDPEEFENYEIGAKWDVLPALSVTAAVFRLDRKNVLVPDPLNPAVSILVDGQKTKGAELGVSGQITDAWSIMGGYAYQDGELTATASPTALAGAALANLPRHTFSLWNRYDFTDMWGVGLGVINRSKMYTSTDNTVTLKGYTRFDAAVFFRLNETLSAQLNVENIFDKKYFLTAHNNNNIMPGAPRSVRASLTVGF